MQTTPKANRLHISLFGRTNVGKSSFLNFITGQDVSITSEIEGTTTDVVEKTMELLPFGPVVFIDTAGIDDVSALGDKRIEKTKKVFERTDVIVLITEAGIWGEYEETVLKRSIDDAIPLMLVINKSDLKEADDDFISKVSTKCGAIMQCSSLSKDKREETLDIFKSSLKKAIPEDYLKEPFLVSDLVSGGDIIILVVPIDLEAPKGRLILPQVQTIRDSLDSDAVTIVVKERELPYMLEQLKTKPKLVVCDSQVVLKVAADVPQDIPMTTFSILFSRFKGDLTQMAKGAAAIDSLTANSKVLIAESCSHHAIGDDIGRVKIPRWLKQYLGFDIAIDHYAGRDFPENIEEYDLIIHCGSCMFNRRQMLYRINLAKQHGVPITNYGIAISLVQGVIKRSLEPFPSALMAFERINKKS